MEKQEGEQRTLLRPAQGEYVSCLLDLEGPEDAEFHFVLTLTRPTTVL